MFLLFTVGPSLCRTAHNQSSILHSKAIHPIIIIIINIAACSDVGVKLNGTL